MTIPSCTSRLWILIILSLGFIQCDDGLPDDPFADIRSSLQVDLNTGVSTMDVSAARANFNNFSFESLGEQEIKGVRFVREEEKLAFEYYTLMNDLFSSDVLSLLTVAEQSHYEISLIPLEKYSISDPTTGMPTGAFQSQSLQAYYNELVDIGSASLLQALITGTAIQEASLVTIQNQLDDVANNRDLRYIYNDLRIATRNHLRTMVAATQANGESYSPRYLSQKDFQEIISSDFEVG